MRISVRYNEENRQDLNYYQSEVRTKLTPHIRVSRSVLPCYRCWTGKFLNEYANDKKKSEAE
jgi:hypothetical protein